MTTPDWIIAAAKLTAKSELECPKCHVRFTRGEQVFNMDKHEITASKLVCPQCGKRMKVAREVFVAWVMGYHAEAKR